MASPADDPLAVPRAYVNLGSVLEMGGFVEEALEVSLAGAQSIQDYGNELSFRTFLEVNVATYLIELGRYAEAAELLEVNVARALPGIGRIHLTVTQAHLAIRTGDLPAARGYLGVARSEMGGVIDAQFVTDLHTFGTEIALWDNDPAGALDIAREGFDRLSEMDDAIIVGQLAIPAAHAAADLAVRARAGRDKAAAERAVAEAVDVIEGYRAATERLSTPDAIAQHEIGWRMALCHAELARARGEDAAADWLAVRPALVARPAPFLEAYVLWRAAEALAGSGEYRGGRRAPARGLCRRGADRGAPAGGGHGRSRAATPARSRAGVQGGVTERRRCRSMSSRRRPTHSGSPPASARSSPWSPRATRTAASPTSCSSATARPASTSRTSWASSASSRGPRRRPSRCGSASTVR